MSKVIPFSVNPEQTAAAINYTSKKFIADQVLPRVPVSKQSPVSPRFSTDTYHRSGRIARSPSEIRWKRENNHIEIESQCADVSVPMLSFYNAPSGQNPLLRATENAMDRVLARREKRAADILFDKRNYTENRCVILRDNEQWNNKESKPFDAIDEALDKCLIRPTHIVFGAPVWKVYKNHSNVREKVLGPENKTGIVTRHALAKALGVESICVGQALMNTSDNEGAVITSQLWGNGCALIYLDRLFDFNDRERVTFGCSAQFGNAVAGSDYIESNPEDEAKDTEALVKELNDGNLRQIPEKVNVRAGETVTELIIAKDLGFLFAEAVS